MEKLRRRNELHGERLCLIQQELHLNDQGEDRRSFETQQLRREWEREMKIDVLSFSRYAQHQGLSKAQLAQRLMLSAATVAGWRREWKENKLPVTPRGRKLRTTDQITRECILAVYYLAGPGIGFPTLRSLFPDAPYRDLAYLLRRIRAMNLHNKGYYVQALRWWVPGSVCALDHVEPPQPVDGIYPYILAVRDLASGCQLLALPVRTKGVAEVVEALEGLFLPHGAPLVLKCDHGFKAELITQLLSEYQVLQLLSPAQYPRYNGAIEAGIGSLQTRAHHESARHGHAGEWSCDDVEAARRQGNELARPWGMGEPSPQEVFKRGQCLEGNYRSWVARVVEKARGEVREELGLLPGMEGTPRQEEAVQRTCITRALVQCAILSIRRSRITPPIMRPLWSRIS